MKKKTIAASLMSIALCGSLVTGATFALFTSEDGANIAINAGKVEMVATITDLKTYSVTADSAAANGYSYVEQTAGSFANGGSAKLEDKNLSLNKLTPGDKVTFTVVLENKSNVAIQYRTLVEEVADGGLFDGLNISIDEQDFEGTTAKSNWTLLTPNEQPADTTMDVVIELPIEAGNAYQEKTADLAISVVAVQANAGVADDTDKLADIATTESGAAANFGFGSESGEPITVNGYGMATASGYQDLWISDDLTISGLTFDNGLRINAKEGSEPLTVTVQDCVIHALDQETIKDQINFASQSRDGLCLDIESNGVAVTFIVKDCVLEGDSTPDMDRDGYDPNNPTQRGKAGGKGVALGEVRGNSNGIVSATIDGCTFNNIRSHAIQLYGGYQSATITNNVFNSWGLNYECTEGKRTEYAVRGDLGNGTLTFEGNEYHIAGPNLGTVSVGGYTGTIGGTIYADSVEGIKGAVAAAKNDVISIAAGVYDFNNETINFDNAATVIGEGEWATELQNVIFDVDSTSADREMKATFKNLKFTGASRVIVGNRTHHNGVGGPDVLPVTALNFTNCYAKSAFSSDSLTGGKGQFVYLAATYTVKLDLTMEGNTMINAHTIADEDSAPIVNGNGTIINKVQITGNTFGDEQNACDRYAVKFGRRANGTKIEIKDNTIYGATTAEKDFYILDLWQSGANVQNDLTVSVMGNSVLCTPNEGRTVYTAYIEATVKGSGIIVESDGTVLNKSVAQ